MPSQYRRLVHAAALGIAVAWLGAACTTETIVFRDREPFNTPPAAAQGFLGYFTVNSKLTTCGNCHVGKQRDWKTTAHAGAYGTLTSDPGAQPACFGCHTVNEAGNGIAVTAGWNAIPDSVYHDVQCESCHGPGLEHVKLPDNPANQPLARAGLDVANASCAACHSGTHYPYAEEWAQSKHAAIVTFAAARVECASCHDGKATLEAWGEHAEYVEKDDPAPFPVVCAVCHDPHGGTGNSKQLRFPIDTPDPERNLCMKCHLRRSEPVPGSNTSPHAPQGAVLIGIAGYRPPGFTFDLNPVLTSHASDRNPRLCAGCHVTRFTVTDQASGNLTFQATGHLFRPIPCLDSEGKPTADKTCAYDPTARSFASCTASGCHASGAIAAQLLTGNRATLETLASVLWVDTDGDRSIDAAPTDQGLLPLVKQMDPSQFISDATITPAEGAEFNVRLAGERGQSNTDNSKGVHNPFLLRALLSASITDIRATYGLPAPPAAVEALIEQSLNKAGVKRVQLSKAPKTR